MIIKVVPSAFLTLTTSLILASPLAADTSRPRASFTPSSASLVHSVGGHGGPLRCIAYSADGRTLATIGNDHQIRIWKDSSDRPQTVLSGTFHPDQVWLSANGTTVIARDAKTLIACDLASSTQKTIIDNVVARFSVSPDGSRLATSTRTTQLTVFNAQTGEELVSLEAPPRSPGIMTWSPNGKRLVDIGQDRIGRVWDAQKGILITQLESVRTTAIDAEFSSDGHLFAVALADAKIRVFDGTSGAELMTLGDRTARAQSLAFSRDNRFLASGHFDGLIRIWDVKTGREVRSLQTHGGIVWSLAFSPDRRSLLSGTNDGRLMTWGQTRGARTNE